MKVLLLVWSGYGFEDIEDAFKANGHTVIKMDFDKNGELRHFPEYEKKLEDMIERHKPDFIFTFNYFPVISFVAKKTDTKAVFWIYDSPFVMLYSYSVIFPQNYIFVFDKELYLEFHKSGINTVYYMPLASNAKRLGSYNDDAYFKKTPWYNKTDIAFVGSMYTEEHQFFRMLKSISDYTRGYLEGIIAAQKKVYGYNFIKELMTKEIMDDMSKDVPMQVDPEGVESLEYLYAQYVINREITARERTELLNAIGEKYKYDLYTNDKNLRLKNCINHGKIEAYHGSPHVFKKAKINLNFTLRSITTGIPMRAFEIMGSRGFLLTNYQADFDDCYVAFEDYVYFESKEDMLDKIEYYLSHEKERAEIAESGYRRTLENHTYTQRINDILEIVTTDIHTSDNQN